MNRELNWIDASLETPPDESLLLVVEDRESKGRVGEMVVGFYADGEYHVGTSMAGDPLPDDQVVRFWAIAKWPHGYDENGIWQEESASVNSAAIPKFKLDGHTFTAEQCVDGVLINPTLPDNFDNTPNDARPASQAKWWNRPFVVTESVEQLDAFYAGRTDEYAEAGRKHWAEGHQQWMEAWPSGTRYETRCLDGGAWDRSTSWGMFATLEEALACAGSGPRWRSR